MVLIIHSKIRATPIITPICVGVAMGVTKNPNPWIQPWSEHKLILAVQTPLCLALEPPQTWMAIFSTVRGQVLGRGAGGARGAIAPK